MASLRNAAVVKIENIDDDNDFAIVALPCSSFSNDSTRKRATTGVASPEPKRQRTEQVEEKKALDDSRKQFRNMLSEEAEIGFLQGFLEFTEQSRGIHSTNAMFLKEIKSKLQLDLDHHVLYEKLRTLRKRHVRALKRINSGKQLVFKRPHDRAIFEISRKIWGNTFPVVGSVEDDEDETNASPNLTYTTPLKNDKANGKKSPKNRLRERTEEKEKRESNDSSGLDDDNNNKNNDSDNNNDNCKCRNSTQSLIDEKRRSCFSQPVLNEFASSAMGSRSSPFGFALDSTVPVSFPNTMSTGEMVVHEKWRKQQILELEVYSKRLELAQEDVKLTLEKLRSAGGGGVCK